MVLTKPVESPSQCKARSLPVLQPNSENSRVAVETTGGLNEGQRWITFFFFFFFSLFSRLWQGCHGDAIRGPHKQSGWEGGGIGKCPCVPTHTHTHTHTAVPGDSITDFDILFRVNPPGLHREFIWASTRHHQCAGGVHNTWRFPLKCSLRFQVNYPPRAPVIFVSSPFCRK